jgi:hypothetical protein
MIFPKIECLLVIAAHCYKHPKYKMIKKPISRCRDCWKLWKYKQYKLEHPDSCSCIRIENSPWCTTSCCD